MAGNHRNRVKCLTLSAVGEKAVTHLCQGTWGISFVRVCECVCVCVCE